MRITIKVIVYVFIIVFLSTSNGLCQKLEYQSIEKTPRGYYPEIRKIKDKTEIGLRVGTIYEKHSVQPILPGKSLIGTMSDNRPGDSLHLSILIPDDREKYPYDFTLKLGEQIIHKRSGETSGFGLRSFFIPLSSNRIANKRNLEIINHSTITLYIQSIQHLPSFNKGLQKTQEDEFILALLVDINHPQSPHYEGIGKLHNVTGIKKAISFEMHYAYLDNSKLNTMVEKCRQWHAKYNLPFVIVPASWWAGTPREVFQKLEYQQICWSESDNYDEGEGLKKLLGDKWDIRYGLTIPNRWSSTPWRTMNNPELNKMCEVKMSIAVQKMEEELGEQVLGYISENEPAYWAGSFPDEKYPVKRKNLWADFNPFTVSKAKEDGIYLDPSKGLPILHRLWFLYNLAEYNQGNINILNSAAQHKPVYSHALLGYNHFPMSGTGYFRPYAEAARLDNCRIGIETLWKVDMDSLWRIREWGKWGCVNREENDDMKMDYHLAMLQSTYMMGGDMLNSYNWHHINQKGEAIRYFNDFLDNIDTSSIVITAENHKGNQWIPFSQWNGNLNISKSFPWSNHLKIGLRTSTNLPLYISLKGEKSENIIAYKTLFPQELTKEFILDIDFGDLTQIEQEEDIILHLESDDKWEWYGDTKSPNYQTYFNLKEERNRSLFLRNQSTYHSKKNIPLKES